MKVIKIAIIVVGLALVFAIGSCAEYYLRVHDRTAIPIRVEGDLQVEASAYVQPDFLWLGEAWRIMVTSEEPVTVDVDGKWRAELPAGTHTIFANHDANNTEEFSAQRYWETPRQIAVASRQPQSATPEPPPAAAVLESSETVNPKPESEAPADGGDR